MKKTIFAFLASICLGLQGFAQNAVQYEYQQMTAIESVVPGGLGRSRLITTGKDGNMEEIKLENFFSLVGINFGNVKNNDKLLASKIEEKVNAGWELVTITPGVYSGAEATGIFITRYLFRKPK